MENVPNQPYWNEEVNICSECEGQVCRVCEDRVCMPDVGAKLLITLEMIRKVCLSLSQWWQIHWDFFNIEDIEKTTHSHYIVIDTRGNWVVVIYSQEASQSFPRKPRGSRLEITCCSHHWKGNQYQGWRRVPPNSNWLCFQYEFLENHKTFSDFTRFSMDYYFPQDGKKHNGSFKGLVLGFCNIL